MTEVQHVETARATHDRSVERPGTLGNSWTDRAAVGAVVASVFFERLDRSLYSHGSVIPDLTFVAGIVILSARYAQQLVRDRVQLSRATAREYIAAGFVVPLVVLGILSVLTLPGWMSSGSQVLKSSVHLAFLAYAAILIGRAVSRELFEFAMKLYFGIASGAAALAIVQALDLNAGHGSLTRHLHLIFRPHPNGYKAPCSIFSEPAQLGYFMVAALVIGVLMWRSIGPRWAIAGSAMCALALLLSFPAGPVLVALVLGLILLIERRPKLSGRAWAGVGALLVVMVAVALASPEGSALYSRASGIVTGSDASAQYRAADSRASIRIWKIAPVTGIGLGDTRRVLPFVFHSRLRANASGFNDSEAYLSLLGETGVLGLAAGLLVIAAFIWPPTRPLRFATVPQLNTIGVAVSFFVAGSFLLPPLWFWGGLALARVRFETQSDLFDSAVARTKQLFRARPAFVLVLLIAVVGAIAYGFSVQRSAGSLHPVRLAQVAMLTTAPHRGDAALARTDEQLWASRDCSRRCTVAPPRLVGGRVWEIKAERPSGRNCLVLDLASFGPTARRSVGPTSGFTGLRACWPGSE